MAVSLNYDIITSFWHHKWPRTPNSEPITVGKLCKAAAVCQLTAYQCAQALCICLIWMQEAVWGAVSLNYDIITSCWLHKWPRTPNSEPITVGELCKAAAVCQWTACWCAQTLCICLIWMQEAVWDCYYPQPCHNDIILTPQVTHQNPKIWAKYGGYKGITV